MALIKKIDLGKWGLSASYWAITEININWDGLKARVVLSGFIDEDSKKKTNELPVDQRIFNYSGELPFTKGGNSEEQAYTKIKTEEEFSDAIDG